MTEIVIILVVALLVMGPKELPEAARSLGKAFRQMRRAGDDLRDTIEREVLEDKQPRPVISRPEGQESAQSPVATRQAEAPSDSAGGSAPAAPVVPDVSGVPDVSKAAAPAPAAGDAS